MTPQHILFIDCDSTVLDQSQIDLKINSINQLRLQPWVIPALLKLQQAGYHLIMMHQDDANINSASPVKFSVAYQTIIQILNSQGIYFDDVLTYSPKLKGNHEYANNKLETLKKYIKKIHFDQKDKYIIDYQPIDLQLAEQLGIQVLQYHPKNLNWELIAEKLLKTAITNIGERTPRFAEVKRKTKETDIKVQVWLDETGINNIDTGIGFFDHMLDQIATHGGFRMNVSVKGDLHVDDHHTVEDTALALGEALKDALADKRGIARFGFTLPMDECRAECALDLSGRPYLIFKAKFKRDKVGDFSTEMVEHFFMSLSYTLACTLHIRVKGKNTHHQVEAIFKCFGRTLRQAIRIEGNELPSSKGVL